MKGITFTIIIVFLFWELGNSQPVLIANMTIAGASSNGEFVYPTQLRVENGFIQSFGNYQTYIRTPVFVAPSNLVNRYKISFNSSGAFTSGNSSAGWVRDASSKNDFTSAVGEVFNPNTMQNDMLVLGSQFEFSIANSYGASVDVNTTGNVFVACEANINTDLNPGSGVLNPSRSGYFIVQYSGIGAYIRMFSVPYGVLIDQISVDNTNNILITGTINGTIDFGGGLNVTSQNGSDRILAKYSEFGNLVWVKVLLDSSPNSPFAITDMTIDNNNNVILVGSLNNNGVVDLDPSQSISNLVSYGSSDFALAKYDLNGNYQFSFNIGSSNSQLTVGGVRVDNGGNIYCAGGYTGTVDFDPSPNGQKTMTAFTIVRASGEDSPKNNNYLIKFKSDGSFQWVYSNPVYFGKGVNIELDANQNLIFQSELYKEFGYGTIYVPHFQYIAYSNIGRFHQPLLINSLSPLSGPVATNVTINGLNFSTIPSENLVYFNGTRATVIASTSSTIVVSVPSGATSGFVTVSVGGLTKTSTQSFTVTVPSITSSNTAPYGSTINLTSYSGGTTGLVTYSVSNGTGSATVLGNSLLLTGVGTVVLTASFAADSNYGATSATQTITITKANQTITFPALSSVCQNESLTLNAYSSSGLPINYSSSNTAIATVSGNIITPKAAGSVTITATQSGNANYNAATSQNSTLVINAVNLITSQPSSAIQTVCISNAVSALSVTATGTGTLTYQWYSNTTNSNTGGTVISGATTSSYTPPSSIAGVRYYYVTVTGACGAVTSNVSGAITINAATAIVTQPLAIQTVCQGTALSPLSVSATGTGPLTYQWYSKLTPTSTGSVISDATTNIYNPLSMVGTIYYYVVVSGSCGNVTSNDSQVTVNSATITITPSSASICANGSTTLTASGMGNYTWSPSSSLSSSTGATVTAYPISTTVYTVTGNLNGCTGTKNVRVNVTSATASISAPNGTNACTGNVILTANAAATYLWSTGETTQSIYPFGAGVYSVTTYNGSCQSTASITIERNPQRCQIARVAMDPVTPTNQDLDEPTVSKLTTYPNPAEDRITVALPEKVSQATPVILYDVNGKVVASQLLSAGQWKAEIDVQKLTEGIYIVRVLNGETLSSAKVIVLR